MTPVERVARAIHQVMYLSDWKDKATSGPQANATREASLEAARAALAAMREPSEGMIRAAFVEMNRTPSGTWKAMKAEKLPPKELFAAKMLPRYRAMIDKALEEG